jgi:hypothetical protein
VVTDDAFDRFSAKLDNLEHAIHRARRRWFCLGVVCGIVGVYLGQLL